MKKLLIVYYSWSNGNTEQIAKKLQSIAGGDLLRIDTAVPYSGSYNDVVEQGQQEVNRGYEPALKPVDVDVAAYDVIAVGTPTWWYTMAPAVKTFLHRYDFAGKTVVLWWGQGLGKRRRRQRVGPQQPERGMRDDHHESPLAIPEL